MPRVKSIPEGYYTLTPGVCVKGAEAFIMPCKKALGANEVLRLPGPGGSVNYAELLVGDTHSVIDGEVPAMGNKSAAALGGTPVTFHVGEPNVDAAMKKPVDMFWGDGYGRVTDLFGNHWAFAPNIEAVTQREMKQRAAKIFST